MLGVWGGAGNVSEDRFDPLMLLSEPISTSNNLPEAELDTCPLSSILFKSETELRVPSYIVHQLSSLGDSVSLASLEAIFASPSTFQLS